MSNSRTEQDSRTLIKRRETARCQYAKALPLILLAGFAVCNSLHAQPAAPPLWVRDSIYSNILGETRYVRISLPVRYDVPHRAVERYPVLIVLDAGDEGPGFTATAVNAQVLAWNGTPAISRVIVVGVETDRARYHDLTPPFVGDTVNHADGSGGAPAFLQFLSTELRPYITARYRTHPVTILAGHSLGGFFTLWVFGQAPDFLAGAIASSPTPLAAQRVLDVIAARTTPGRLFVVNGMSEVFMDSATQAFAAALNARPVSGRVFEYQRLPNASHYITAQLAMTPGLQFIFRPVSLAGYQLEFSEGDDVMSKFRVVFDSTREAYLGGARELGLDQRLPFDFLFGQSTHYQQPLMAPLLLRVCEELISSYPASWTGYDCAGNAQMSLGRDSEAAANHRRAIEAARNAGDSATAARLARKVEGR